MFFEASRFSTPLRHARCWDVACGCSSSRLSGVELGSRLLRQFGPRRRAGKIDADKAGEGGVWRIGGGDSGLRGSSYDGGGRTRRAVELLDVEIRVHLGMAIRSTSW